MNIQQIIVLTQTEINSLLTESLNKKYGTSGEWNIIYHSNEGHPFFSDIKVTASMSYEKNVKEECQPDAGTATEDKNEVTINNLALKWAAKAKKAEAEVKRLLKEVECHRNEMPTISERIASELEINTLCILGYIQANGIKPLPIAFQAISDELDRRKVPQVRRIAIANSYMHITNQADPSWTDKATSDISERIAGELETDTLCVLTYSQTTGLKPPPITLQAMRSELDLRLIPQTQRITIANTYDAKETDSSSYLRCKY